MGQYTSYYLYQKYEKRGDQPFTPVYPMEYSVDGNGTMSLVTKNDNDPNCGYSGDTPSVQYRWVNAPINLDYVCDECPEPIYRTTSGTPYCDGYNRTVDTTYQVSYDEGETWNTLSSGSTVLVYDSPECGYPIYRWVDTDDYVCESADYENQYLTFDIISGGTINWVKADAVGISSQTISYSKDGGATWTNVTSTVGSNGHGTKIPVNAGDKIYWKGLNDFYNCNLNEDCGFDSSFRFSTATFNVYGNIMSLIYGDNFYNQNEFPTGTKANFAGLFGSTNVIDASGLVLPATILTPHCYRELFWDCEKLIGAPELHSTTLAKACYGQMFFGCNSLATPPELPATTLADYCYMQMFNGCAFTQAPELPATTLTNYCYFGMFEGCLNLNYVKCLATDRSASGCTGEWLGLVSPTGTFVKAEGMTGWPRNETGIPVGWNVIDYNDYSVEYLTFDVLVSGDIVWKSNGCETKTISYSRDSGSTWTQITSSTAGTSFNVSVGDKILFKGTNSSYGGTCNGQATGFGTFGDSSAAFNVYGNIMSLIYGDNFMNQTQFPSGSEDNFNSLFASGNIGNVISAENLVLPVTAMTHGCYANMFKNCNSLTTPPELPATTLAATCYSGMFDSCPMMTTAPALPATTLARNCYYQMFNECRSLTMAPELPAPTVLTGSYIQMFWNCTSLNYIKCLATDVSASGSTFMWTNGVASTGTFIKASSMSSWPTGEDGIPTGWTVQNAS